MPIEKYAAWADIACYQSSGLWEKAARTGKKLIRLIFKDLFNSLILCLDG